MDLIETDLGAAEELEVGEVEEEEGMFYFVYMNSILNRMCLFHISVIELIIPGELWEILALLWNNLSSPPFAPKQSYGCFSLANNLCFW